MNKEGLHTILKIGILLFPKYTKTLKNTEIEVEGNGLRPLHCLDKY